MRSVPSFSCILHIPSTCPALRGPVKNPGISLRPFAPLRGIKPGPLLCLSRLLAAIRLLRALRPKDFRRSRPRFAKRTSPLGKLIGGGLGFAYHVSDRPFLGKPTGKCWEHHPISRVKGL